MRTSENNPSRNCLKRGSSGAPSADLVGMPGQNGPNSAASVSQEATSDAPSGLFRQFQGEVRPPPVRWDGNSRVIAMLRVATACYEPSPRMVRARAMGPAEGKHRAGPNGGDRP